MKHLDIFKRGRFRVPQIKLQCLLAAAMLPLTMNAQNVYTGGNVTLLTQADVNSFGANNYTNLANARLDIGPSTGATAIKDLSPLTTIDSIAGRLQIYANDSLQSLNGLNHLSSTGGALWVELNPVLHDMHALASLKHIGAEAVVLRNDALRSLNGLQNLEKVQANLHIGSRPGNPGQTNRGNSVLVDFCALTKLLTTAHGLAGTYNVANNVFNPDSNDIVAGTCTERIYYGNVSLIRQGQLDTFGSNSYIKITGKLEIGTAAGGSTIKDLSPLASIDSIGGGLQVLFMDTLETLHGLDNMKSVGGELWIEGNSKLRDITALTSLTYIGNALVVLRNNTLRSLNGLQGLEKIQANLHVGSRPGNPGQTNRGNSLLEDFCALTNVLTTTGGLAGTFHVANNIFNPDSSAMVAGHCADTVYHGDANFNTQAQLNAFGSRYTRIQGQLNIGPSSGTGAITDLSPLANIDTITNSLQVISNDSLQTLNGLNVESVGRNLYMESNPKLSSISALSALKYINRDLIIFNCDTLRSLHGLQYVGVIGRNIYIGTDWNTPSQPYGNDILEDFCALTNVITTNGLAGSYNVANNTYNPRWADYAAGDCDITAYRPATAAADLSSLTDWVDAGHISPADFSTPGTLFTIGKAGHYTVNNNWTVSGGADVYVDTVNAVITVQPGVRFTVGAGSKADLNGQNLILKSDHTGTASVGRIEGTLSGASNVTVERYISSGSRPGWRLLAAPVQAATAPTIYEAWQENGNAAIGYGTHIVNTVMASGYDGIAGFSSIRSYHAETDTFYTPANTHAIKITDSGAAWFLHVRGDRTVTGNAPAGNTTLRMTGALNIGAVHYVGSGVANTDYTLIPNPYASPVDFEAIRSNGSGNPGALAGNPQLEVFYIWDANLGTSGAFAAVDRNGGNYQVTPSGQSQSLNATASYIQGGQAFFVEGTKASPGAAGLHFTEAMKTASYPDFNVLKTTAGTEEVAVNLIRMTGTDTALMDGVRIKFDAAYTNAVTAEDIKKMRNSTENLSVYQDGADLAVNRLSFPAANDTVQLRFWNPELSNYRFSFLPDNIGSFSNVYLLDNYLGTATALSTTTAGAYDFNVTATAGSPDSYRFSLVFERSAPLQVSGMTLSGTVQESTASLLWDVTAEKGISRYEVEHSGDQGKTFGRISAIAPKSNDNSNQIYAYKDVAMKEGNNLYRIKSLSAAGTQAYSNIIRLAYTGMAAGKGVSIFPNPVKDGTVNVQLNHLEDGRYEVSVYNTSGMLVNKTTVRHAGKNSMHTIAFGKELPAGVYNVNIVNHATGISYQQQVQVQ